MGDLYGERWRVQRSLSEGGQAHTFIVSDVNDSTSAPFVLKRLKNLTRFRRFETEVKTCPELAHGIADEVTSAADVYSLGKILYWMLAGKIFDREVHRNIRYDLTKGETRPDYFFMYKLFDQTICENPRSRLPDANEVSNAV